MLIGLVAGYLAPAKGWRWTFWLVSILVSFTPVTLVRQLTDIIQGRRIIYRRSIVLTRV